MMSTVEARAIEGDMRTTSSIQGRWMPERTSWSPKARAMPTSSAPTAAPMKLPMPPITTAMNAWS